MSEPAGSVLETGAIRHPVPVRYDLITPIGLRRLAETYHEGAGKYSDRNWEKGQPLSLLLNHALKHLNEYQAERRGLKPKTDEDHLAHAAWNILAMMHFEEAMPEMDDISLAAEIAEITEPDVAERVECYCEERVIGMCVPCAIRDRHAAGESIKSLAYDFQRPVGRIQKIVEWSPER